MKKLVLGLAALASAAVVSTAVIADEGTAPNRSVEKAEAQASSAVADVATAAALVDWGRANKSPEALVTAAQMIVSLPEGATAESRKKESVQGKGEAGEKAEGAALSLDPAALVSEAAAMAKAAGNKDLAKHLGKMTVSTRGATGGPKYVVEQVLANATDVYVVSFNGLEQAEVALAGDGDTDLDLFVFDEYGNQIASDVSYADKAYVSWTPKWTGNFRVEVRNRGNVYNRYVLVTN
ncbi:MAG: hypothetical protein H6739_13895 [Alphaproteobacteria bacterium]|nr:hypothetical protein [Alphaproteobacteria bacterium]